MNAEKRYLNAEKRYLNAEKRYLKTPLLVRKQAFVVLIIFQCALLLFMGRVLFIQLYHGEFLRAEAFEQQTRDRLIRPSRGGILDRNMVELATTETVASVSVIFSQLADIPGTARILAQLLELDEAATLEKISRRVALVRVAQKVDKEIADKLRMMDIPGVVIDEDIRRVYPFGSLGSHIIGFVGSDNQGIIGLEAKYDTYLMGQPGKILTQTDVRGRLIEGGRQYRIPPVDGYDLVLTIDAVLQVYAEQTIELLVQQKNAKRGVIILMNPSNGQIYALANKPDFDLNDPFTIQDPALALEWDTLSTEARSNALNQMWRNFAINDTYEPGSTFKIVTSAAGLAEGLVTLDSRFSCGGSMTVGGRQIRCWRSPRSHGAQTFSQGVQNSCNPVFMTIGEQLGAELFHEYLMRFGFNQKTGIDLPGEAVGIMYAADKTGPVELATMAFGQSLTITPLQLVSAAATVINGGYLVTPHVGMRLIDTEGNIAREFAPPVGEQILPTEVSDTMRFVLESVVALVLVDEPQGVYYGGQVTGPVMQVLLENVLPYLGVKPMYNEAELALEGVAPTTVPNLRGLPKPEALKLLQEADLGHLITGQGDTIADQFPIPGEFVNRGEKVLLRAK